MREAAIRKSREVNLMNATSAKHQAKLEEWQYRIMACRSSGMSVTEWCAQEGVNSKTYYRWEREVLGLLTAQRMTPATAADVEFVPVNPARDNTAVKLAGGASEVTATVRMKTAAIDFYSGGDLDVVQTIIRELRSC